MAFAVAPSSCSTRCADERLIPPPPHPNPPSFFNLISPQHHYYDWWSLGFFLPRVFMNVLSFGLSLIKEPLSYKLDDDPNPSPERWAPLFSIISFWWMNGFMRLGYKRALQQEDLWSLEPTDRAHYLSAQFKRQWAKQLRRGRDKASLVAVGLGV